MVVTSYFPEDVHSLCLQLCVRNPIAVLMTQHYVDLDSDTLFSWLRRLSYLYGMIGL